MIERIATFASSCGKRPTVGCRGLGNLLAMPAARQESVTREGFAEPLGFARLTPDRK
jgi:hypothetical protein